MQNDKIYWEKQFVNPLEIKMKLSQANFFFNIFSKLFPKEIKNYIVKNNLSCCDFGCGLGNFTNNLLKLFPESQIYGIDYAENAINYASKKFLNVDFLNIDYNKLDKVFDVIITSNTLEHFSNPYEVIEKLLNHTNKFFIMLIPFEEEELYKEHLFSFQKDFFKEHIENFDLIYLKSIDLSATFNTMWVGKQILAIYKKNDFEFDFCKIFNTNVNFKKNILNKINYNINIFKRDMYRNIRNILTKNVY